MDFTKLAEDLCLEKEEYLELIELFIEVGMADLNKIYQAFQEGNAEKVADATHSLKGASSSLGLVEIFKAAKEIEEKIQNKHLDGALAAFQALKGEFKMLSDFVRNPI